MHMFKTRTRQSFVSLLALTALAVLALTPNPALAARGNPLAVPGAPSASQYEIMVEYDLEIPMPDGTIIRADVYRPDAEGKFPVLVEGTPYGKLASTDLRFGADKFFVPKGYIMVIWDLRGRGVSDGVFDPHMDIISDSYHVIDWIVDQPWSNGKVGAIGNSYAGQSALFTGMSQHPALLCAIPQHTSANQWRQWYYRGGAMEFGFISGWGANQISTDTAGRLLEGAALEEWQDTFSLYSIDAQTYSMIVPLLDFEPTKITQDVNYFRDWALHPTDGWYWWQRNPETYVREFNVPALHWGSYYDNFTEGTIGIFNDIIRKGATSLARDNQYLLLGSWGHGSSSRKTNAIDGGPAVVTPTPDQIRLSFFDYWLKDTLHGEMTSFLDQPVRYFNRGVNEWRYADSWPIPGIAYTSFYLNPAPGASTVTLYDGALSQNPSTGDVSVTYAYDPMDPIPTRGGSQIGNFVYEPGGAPYSGAVDQHLVEARSLTFTSDFLKEQLEITGETYAHIFASSDCVDTDFIVRVSEVYPDGNSYNVVEGIQRARFRTSGINPTLLTPGQVYEFEIDLWSTSHTFMPGNRIRVTINSSSFPRWSRNMNVAEFPEQATDWKVANNTIYLSPEYPSHVVFPVIPK